MKASLIILIIIGYIVGMFITKIVITVHDNYVSPSNRVDDFDVVFMIIWPIILPFICLSDLFIKLYKIAENIGNKIAIKLRYRKFGITKPKKNRGEDDE